MSKAKTKLRSFDAFFELVLRHPYIFITLVCALLFPLGFAEASQIHEEHIVFFCFLWAIGIAVLVMVGKPSKSSAVNLYLLISSVIR